MQRCITGFKRIGLKVNPKKTEIINVGHAAGIFSRVVNSFNELPPEVKVSELTEMELLGSPILNDATRCCIVKKLSEYRRVILLDGYLMVKQASSCLNIPPPSLNMPSPSRASCLTSGLRHVGTFIATTHSVSTSLTVSDSLSVFLIDANVERRCTRSVRILCRAASALGAFRPKRRGLSAVGIPSMFEPFGLDRGDGKLPDVITVYHYSRGRCLILDATCVNTSASSNQIRSALAAGSVADAIRKIAKYAELGRRFIFQTVAVETSGAMGKSTIQFFKDLGRRLAVQFQDKRESDFLFQGVSLAILRCYAFSISQSYRD